MKARRLRSMLERELGYVVVPGRGKGLRDEVGARVVRRTLIKEAGLTLEQAKEVAARG